MRFIIVALALMAMFSTASAQFDNLMAMKMFQQMQQKQNQGTGAGGGTGGMFNPAAAMMGDFGSELMDYLMYKNMMGRNTGTAVGTGAASNNAVGGMNPLMAATMLDSSDLMMMNLLNGNHGNARHNRAQMMGGGYPMMGGYSNPMANLMMAETMDLFGGNMEGLGAMALLGGMSAPRMPMMGGYPQYRYPAAATAGATSSPYSYQTRPDKYYPSHPASSRGAPHQFMPQMGMGMPMGGMGGMGMGNPSMNNLFMMNALSGGDLITNDMAKDLGGVMMMNNMMHPPMMNYGNPYAHATAAYPYYYARPTTSTATPTSGSTNTGYASRINSGKRGSIADSLWEMNLIQSWLNPNQQTGAGAGAGTQANPANASAQSNIAQLAAMEMALGDTPVEQAAQPASDKSGPANQDAGSGATTSDTAPTTPKGQ